LRDVHGLEVLIPGRADRQIVHRVIYEELVMGIHRGESRAEYLRIMQALQERGAQGIIEGCTEIVMLVQQKHTAIPLFDTTALHAHKAVEMALS
jgi:aspartate racemase